MRDDPTGDLGAWLHRVQRCQRATSGARCTGRHVAMPLLSHAFARSTGQGIQIYSGLGEQKLGRNKPAAASRTPSTTIRPSRPVNPAASVESSNPIRECRTRPRLACAYPRSHSDPIDTTRQRLRRTRRRYVMRYASGASGPTAELPAFRSNGWTNAGYTRPCQHNFEMHDLWLSRRGQHDLCRPRQWPPEIIPGGQPVLFRERRH